MDDTDLLIQQALATKKKKPAVKPAATVAPENDTDALIKQALEQRATQPAVPSSTAGQTLSNIGGFVSGMVKPVVAGVNKFAQTLPEAAYQKQTSPLQYGVGVAKGLAQTGLNLTVNPLISLASSVATNPAVQGMQPIQPKFLQPSGRAQEAGSTIGSGIGTVAALASPFLPKGAAGLKAKSISEMARPELMTAREVKREIKSVDVAPRGGIFSTLDARERNALVKPIYKGDVTFDKYAAQAGKSQREAGEMSSMDLVGTRGDEAVEILNQKRAAMGEQKGKLIESADEYAINNNQFVNTKGVENNFKKLLEERGGVKIDKMGNIGDVAGRQSRIASEKTLVKQLDDIIQKIGEESTPRQIDDARAAIQDALGGFERQPGGSTIVEGIGTAIRKQLDDKLDGWATEKGFDAYKNINKRYAELSQRTTMLDKMLGAVVDEKTGMRTRGASVMKSSVMSNSDRGTKALFEQVRQETGIDLVKESMYAKIAMDAVGDTRATDLLRTSAETKNLIGATFTGTALKAGQKAISALRGDKLSQLVRYYTRVHSKHAPVMVPLVRETESAKKSLSEMLKQ
jgi:hypothetical protein